MIGSTRRIDAKSVPEASPMGLHPPPLSSAHVRAANGPDGLVRRPGVDVPGWDRPDVGAGEHGAGPQRCGCR